MKITLIIIVVLVAGYIAFMRLAPSNPARWHVAHDGRDLGHQPGANWHVFRERVSDGPGRLAELDAAMQALPRTEVQAGSVEEGQITYVTRSKVIGYPDYTTLTLKGEVLEVYARARFGKSDLGVNRARVAGLPGVPQP